MDWGLTGDIFRFLDFIPTAPRNRSMIDDPVINAAKDAIDAAYFDNAKRFQLFKDVMPYILDQAYVLPLPTPYSYEIWQPWVKQYSGEHYIGFANSRAAFCNYVWYDQELKKKMTGR